MHEMLHIIGLCPDSFSHTNMIEVLITNYQTINDFINSNNKINVIKFTPGARASTN